MHHRFQSSPLSLHTGIGFQLNLGLSPLNTILLVPRYQIGKEKCIRPLGTIFRKNTDEEEVNDVAGDEVEVEETELRLDKLIYLLL